MNRDVSKTKATARIVVNVGHERAFDYEIPEALASAVRVGSVVRVPFGNSIRTGFVIALPENPNIQDLKPIHEVMGTKELLSTNLLRLARWMASYYCCTVEQVMRAMLPAAVRAGSKGHKRRKMVRLADLANVALAMEKLAKKAPRQSAALKELVHRRSLALTQLTSKTGVSLQAIRSLEQQKLVILEDELDERDPFLDVEIIPTTPLQLSPDQEAVIEKIHDSLEANRNDVILLFGVTGSGKTEIYLQAISRCLARGRDAIVLVPEIALTPQTMERFRGRFGTTVSILHSHLSTRERLDEWTKISEGRAKIVVGARSALFAPFRQLGLIVVDEEHESTYKQETVPRYQARDVAVMRAKFENATVILGSATPSLESYYNTIVGKYSLATLRSRIEDRALPRMEIVDMAAEAAATGQPQILSRRLVSITHEILEQHEQAMFFLNRRGYAKQLHCLKCGFTAGCPDCSINLTYHRGQGHLICHLCGHAQGAPKHCPNCRDAGIRYSGIGTEKVESVVKARFPAATVCRMDSDTMTKKHSYRETLTAFRAGEIDILIGTQMIAKGLHFPNLSLVGIIFADQTLNIPDFRAGERTFQLLVQVAGRSGRGDIPGRVIVQTFTPHHPVLEAAVRQDFESFYQREIQSRKLLKLPPVRRFVLIAVRGEDEERVKQCVALLHARLQQSLDPTHELCAPLPSPILRRRKQYQYQITLSTPKIATLGPALKSIIAEFRHSRKMTISVDMDPYSMM